MNTPSQVACFELDWTDWTGPAGRVGRMKFRMKGSVFPGDTIAMRGAVSETETDDQGCAWITLQVALAVNGDTKTACTVRVAVPSEPGGNPWTRTGEQWRP